MLRIVAAVGALALCATAVFAQNIDAIKQRQAAMKANGAAAKTMGAMVKGDAPFDAAKVKASLKVFQDEAAKLKTLFPDDSKTGENTAALPAVWENKADFLSRMDKFAADAKAAESTMTDEASFKAAWPKFAGDACGGCHKLYRVPPK
jgi:cytochrome c556